MLSALVLRLDTCIKSCKCLFLKPLNKCSPDFIRGLLSKCYCWFDWMVPQQWIRDHRVRVWKKKKKKKKKKHTRFFVFFFVLFFCFCFFFLQNNGSFAAESWYIAPRTQSQDDKTNIWPFYCKAKLASPYVWWKCWKKIIFSKFVKDLWLKLTMYT